MSKKRSFHTLSDHFAGCGGSGWGAKEALDAIGGRILYAANHWKRATQSYEASNIADDVSCTDLSACDPRRFPSTDGSLWSPECTTHTPAGGNTHKQLKRQMDMFNKNTIDPATERSRATMWDVCRFAEYHKYNYMICENVVEVKTRWVLFDDWLRAMHTLGYEHECVYLNSMFFFPTPQSRDRIYIVFWKKGNKKPNLDYMPLAWCSTCTHDVNALQCWKDSSKQFGKYNQQYVYCCPGCANIVNPYYYAAFNCIDWTDIGQRIGDKKKELADNTMIRIQNGLDTYGEEPLIIDDKHSTGISFRVRTVSDKFPVFDCEPRIKLVVPPMITNCEKHTKKKIKSSMDSLYTQTTRQTSALVVTPWIIEMNRTGECKPSDNPMSSITSGGINHAILHAPYLVNNKGQSKSRRITDATNIMTTKISQGLVTSQAWNSFISCFNGNGGNKSIHQSLPTQASKDRLMLVNYQKPKIEDCYYRMLKPLEVKKGMAFDDRHIILGSGKEIVKQCGNAVTPKVMKWLTERCLETLQ